VRTNGLPWGSDLWDNPLVDRGEFSSRQKKWAHAIFPRVGIWGHSVSWLRFLRLFVLKITYSGGLGAVIADAFVVEGCNIAINYASREDPAVELQDKLIKEFGVRSCVIKGMS
jgi:hypothetical protein